MQEWDRIVPLLAQLGVMTHVDRTELVNYCTAWSTFVVNQRRLDEEGATIKGSMGSEIKNPVASVVSEASLRLHRYCQEFGLTPASRTRIKMEKTDDRSEMDKRMFGP